MKIYGSDKKNIPLINKPGTTNRNLDFIFCDFIKHPTASIIKENTSNIARIITITLKLTKKMEDTTFSKLSI